MTEDRLVHVARLPLSAGSTAVPEALWLDTRALRFVVVPVANGDQPQSATPLDDYLATHPDRSDSVRTALTERLQELPLPVPGGRDRLLDRKRKMNADELIARVTPDNVHPETESGPPVGNEEW